MGNEKKQTPSVKWIAGGLAVLAVVLLGVLFFVKNGSGREQQYLWYKGQPSQVNKEPDRKNEFVIGGNDIPADPRICQQYGNTAQQISRLVYEPLVRVNRAKEVQPVLAESVTFSEDGLTAEITLKNKTFSDGTPVTAEDVVESYRLLNEPMSQNPLKSVMTAIEGMEAFQYGEAETFGVQVLEDGKVQFQFASASVDNLEALTAPIVKKTEGELFALGSGGYQIDRMQGMAEVQLVRNPEGQTDLPYERIRFVNATRQRMEQSAEDCSIDAVQINVGAMAELMKEAGCYDIYAYPAGTRAYLSFSADTSQTVRQAVNAMFDSEAFWKEMEPVLGAEGAYAPSARFVSPYYGGSTAFGSGQNPKKLAKALEQERGEAVLNFRMDGSALSRSRFQILAEQFEQYGVRLEPVYTENAEEGAAYDFTFSAGETRAPEQLLRDGTTDEAAQASAERTAKQLHRDYRKIYEDLEQQAGETMPVIPAGAQTAYWAVLADARNSEILQILMG